MEKIVGVMVQCMLVALVCFVNAKKVFGDIGTATSYSPPYSPTRCPGYDQDQLPVNGLFVAAGSSIWDNGAACGKWYQVRCLSGLKLPCRDGYVVVQVVDLCRFSLCPTMAFSDKAFDALSMIPNIKIYIEYQRVGEHFSLADNYEKTNPSTADAKAIFNPQESKKDPSSPEHIGVAQNKDEYGVFVHAPAARKPDTNFMSHKDEGAGRGSDVVHIDGRKLLKSDNMNAYIDDNAMKDHEPPSEPNGCSHGVSGAFCAGGGH